MYFYFGIITASMLIKANADPVLTPPVELSYEYGSNVTIDEERGGKAAIATALIDLGGKLIIDGPKGSLVNFWEYKGNYIIESECWEDGSGPCTNGNCLDFKGRRGMKIQETQVKCAWFCFHRTHCRLQTCCPFTNKRPRTNGGNPSTEFRPIDAAFCKIAVDRSRKPSTIKIQLGGRPLATGEIDETDQNVHVGWVNFPDDKQYRFWYYAAEGFIYWGADKGKTGNIWRGSVAGSCG